MNKYFISFKDNLRISACPLILFKSGVLACVIWQSIGNLLDSNLIFGSKGLFPAALAEQYYTTPAYTFNETTGRVICVAMIAFSLLALLRRFQSYSFLAIAIFEILLLKRNFIFTNSGDSALAYLTLIAAFLPHVGIQDRSAEIRLESLLPLYVLNSIVYLINLGFKVSSRWATGQGLTDSIRHLELSRLPDLADHLFLLRTLDYFAIFIVLLAVILPWISLEQRAFRNGGVLLVCTYHLLANVFMKLSWLSIPFLLFELALWAPKQVRVGSNERMENKTRVAWILVLLGFFGMKDPGDLSAFNENVLVPIGHNWYMFAPPPPATGKWEAAVTKAGVTETVNLSQDFSKTEFFIFQHQYKFYNNLGRSELLPVANHFAHWLCFHFGDPQPNSIKLVHTTHVFQSEQDFKIEYPEVSCLKTSQSEADIQSNQK